MYSVASKSVLTKGVVTPLASMELTLLPGVVPLATVIVCFGKIDWLIRATQLSFEMVNTLTTGLSEYL